MLDENNKPVKTKTGVLALRDAILIMAKYLPENDPYRITIDIIHSEIKSGKLKIKDD